MNKIIRVLVVDDSVIVRGILTKGLDKDPEIEVVGTASDPYEARDQIIELRPDVMTLDIEMPKMTGIEFLKKLMPQYPMPVIMVSALTEKGKKITFDALEAGAVDFICKPQGDVTQGLSEMVTELRKKIKAAAEVNISQLKSNINRRQAKVANITISTQIASKNKIIAIGASAGGTEAIREIITRYPAKTPGVVIVQHMPPGFTALYAERMNALCQMEVTEARDGDRILPGKVLIAPGGKQMRVIRTGNDYSVQITTEDMVNGHAPSIEVLFDSVAKQVGRNAVGVMLTGMGKDGVEGMYNMRQAGARCIAQDEASCVIFGLPREAKARGGVERFVPLDKIAVTTLDLVEGRG